MVHRKMWVGKMILWQKSWKYKTGNWMMIILELRFMTENFALKQIDIYYTTDDNCTTWVIWQLKLATISCGYSFTFTFKKNTHKDTLIWQQLQLIPGHFCVNTLFSSAICMNINFLHKCIQNNSFFCNYISVFLLKNTLINLYFLVLYIPKYQHVCLINGLTVSPVLTHNNFLHFVAKFSFYVAYYLYVRLLFLLKCIQISHFVFRYLDSTISR